MKRKEQLVTELAEVIDEGRRPHVQMLSSRLSWHPSDVHRCLNQLEKEGRIESYRKELLGNKMRMVALKR